MSPKIKPCSTSLGQIHLDVVKKQNKAYNFEVNIGLLLLCSIVTKNQALFYKFGVDLFRWSHEMEKYI